jgi:hypothetical protein
MESDFDPEEHQAELVARFRAFLSEHGISFAPKEYAGTSNSIRILALATHRSMLDLVQAADAIHYEEALAITRHMALRTLWQQNELDTAWRALVEQEFPGPALSTEQIAQFSAETGDMILEQATQAQFYAAIQEEVLDFFRAAQHNLTAEDEIAAALVASTIAIWRAPLLTGAPQRPAITIREQLEQSIQKASEPGNPVWQALIKYLLET